MKGKKKIIKKELSRTERHFGVILENVDSKIDLVVEGHRALGKKIDKLGAEVENLRTEMNYKFEVVFDELRLIRN